MMMILVYCPSSTLGYVDYIAKEIHPTSYPLSMVHKHDVAVDPWVLVVLNPPSRAGCYVNKGTIMVLSLSLFR